MKTWYRDFSGNIVKIEFEKMESLTDLQCTLGDAWLKQYEKNNKSWAGYLWEIRTELEEHLEK